MLQCLISCLFAVRRSPCSEYYESFLHFTFFVCFGFDCVKGCMFSHYERDRAFRTSVCVTLFPGVLTRPQLVRLFYSLEVYFFVCSCFSWLLSSSHMVNFLKKFPHHAFSPLMVLQNKNKGKRILEMKTDVINIC